MIRTKVDFSEVHLCGKLCVNFHCVTEGNIIEYYQTFGQI